MEQVVLNAVRRDVIGKQVKAKRREGQLPAVMYGHHITPTPIFLDMRDASRILNSISQSALVTINLEGENHTALVREKQRHFLMGTLLHIDFQVVSMLEKLRTRISVVFEGESPAVNDFQAILVTGSDSLEVECLPGDLPEKITVDISSLKEIGSSIHVKDLNLPGTIILLDDPETMLVVATAQEEEPEVEEVALETMQAEPEVIEKGKKEEEEDEI